MERKYIVELKSPLQEPQLSLVAAEVGKELKISPEKFSTLLRRGAGPLTKGVDASVAERIARVARAAGADIELIENGGVAQAVAVAPAPASTSASASASTSASASASTPASARTSPAAPLVAEPQAEPNPAEPHAAVHPESLNADPAPMPSVTFAAAPTDLGSSSGSQTPASSSDAWEADSPAHGVEEAAPGEVGATSAAPDEVYAAARADAEPAVRAQRAPWLIPAVLVAVVVLVILAYLGLR